MLMELRHSAVAGTMESSDVQVIIEPFDNGIELTLESSVLAQYGDQIEQTIREVLKQLGVEHARLIVRDKGALDCTIRARVQTAVFRTVNQTEHLPWEAMK